MTEEWRDIAGFEGRYQVSSLGRVKALSFLQRYLLRTGVEAFRRTKERLVAESKHPQGYKLAHLHLNNKRTARTIHRLVAETFLPGPRKRAINHKDGVKCHNWAGNLEWVTYKENAHHALELGLMPFAIRVKCPTTGRVFSSIAKAARECHRSHRKIRTTFLRTSEPCTI